MHGVSVRVEKFLNFYLFCISGAWERGQATVEIVNKNGGHGAGSSNKKYIYVGGKSPFVVKVGKTLNTVGSKKIY